MTADLPGLPIFLHTTGCPGSLPASDTGPLLSPLTSYTVVLTLALDAEQPCAGDPSTLSDPELVQPLLLGLAEALPALRGACNASHREVWQLLLHVGAIFKFAGQRCSSAAQQMLLRSTAQQGGPLLIKLVRDVAAALPSSPPADVPHGTVTSVRIGLCSALTLLLLPDSESSGGSSEADSLPLSPADWSALEAFSLLSSAICQAASPPSQLRSDLCWKRATCCVALYSASGPCFSAWLSAAPPSSCSLCLTWHGRQAASCRCLFVAQQRRQHQQNKTLESWAWAA